MKYLKIDTKTLTNSWYLSTPILINLAQVLDIKISAEKVDNELNTYLVITMLESRTHKFLLKDKDVAIVDAIVRCIQDDDTNNVYDMTKYLKSINMHDEYQT